MLETFGELQLPLLAAVLVTAALAKLILRGPDGPDSAHVLDALRHHRGLTVLTALAEAGLGAALLVAPVLEVRVATVVWFVAATWVVDELRARRPDAGCGCFGALSTTRIGWRVLVRPLVLAGAATATLPAPASEVYRHLAGPGVALPLAEFAVLIGFSPELGVLIARWRSQPPCEIRQVPLADTLDTLHSSQAWRDRRNTLLSRRPVEVWRELCWRFLVYPAEVDGMEGEVVFAVSLAGTRHPEVRAALVFPPAAGDSGGGEADSDVEDTGPNPLATPVAV
jgi:hypothetical protein